MGKAYKRDNPLSFLKPDDPLRAYLEGGFDLMLQFSRRNELDPKPEIRELWAKHRSAIMTTWLKEHAPGQRPFAFWLFDVPAGTKRRFRPGKELPRDQGGVELERTRLKKCDEPLTEALLSPDGYDYGVLPYATYDPNDLGDIEGNLDLLERLGVFMTATEKQALKDLKKKEGRT